jgi:hypothetical protein
VSDQLSPQRLLWLLRSDVLRNYRSWVVTSGTVALVALLFSWLGAWDGVVGAGFYDRVFVAMLFGWGTITTSQAFTDLHGRGTNVAFLLLPASALEKTAVRLMLHTVFLFLYLLVFTTALSFVLEGINEALFGVRREFFSPFDGTPWWIFPHYLVVQGVFFLGAAWFRKAHFVKTVGAVLALWFGLSFSAVGIAWLLGPGEMFFDGGGAAAFFNSLERIADGAKVAYHFVLPAFCWFVAWLRVTETQVSHGI